MKPGVQVITPNPQDLGRRALELSRGLGLCPEEGAGDWQAPGSAQAAAVTAAGEGAVHHRALGTFRSSTRARAARPRTFVQRQLGDVLLAWENEAFLSVKELARIKLDIVVPSLSILAEPLGGGGRCHRREARHQARSRTRTSNYLYSPAGQRLIARHLLPPAQPVERGSGRSGPLPAARADHRGPGVRRLEQGPERPLRRRRDLRCGLRTRERCSRHV